MLDNVELDNEIMAAEDEELGHESLSPESSRTLLEDAPPPPPQNDTPNEYKLGTFVCGCLSVLLSAGLCLNVCFCHDAGSGCV